MAYTSGEPRTALRGRLIACALAVIGATVGAAADTVIVDLNALPLYVKKGFDQTDARTAPIPGDPRWTVLPPTETGSRTARTMHILPGGLPKRSFFSFASLGEMEFTYSIPFNLAQAELAALDAQTDFAGVPGAIFAGLGDNWEVFINGTRVRSEVHLDADGRIRANRDQREVLVAFTRSLLSVGDNLIVVRIIGNPHHSSTGFHLAKPYYLGAYEEMRRRFDETWPMMLISLYLFIGVYHLFIYLVRRRDNQNLFYGLFSIDLGIYLLMRTRTIYALIPDSELLLRVELFSLFILLPIVGTFLELLNGNRTSTVTRVYAVFCALIAVLQALAPRVIALDILLIWQYTGLTMAFYYFGYEIFWRYISGGLRRAKRARLSGSPRSLTLIYLSDLVSTPQGNIVIGGAILFVTAVFDILDALFLKLDVVATQYGFFVFTMGTALILANRFSFLYSRLSDLNQSLETRITEIREASDKLAASERKYRSLFEGTSDPVAILNDGLGFIDGNKAAESFFGWEWPGRRDLSLPELIFTDEREGTLPAQHFRAEAAGLRDRNGPWETVLRLRSPLGEAVECRLRLERIKTLDREEILLRVVPQTEDALTPSFVEGRERYDIESTLSAADEICRRAIANVSRYLPKDDAGFLMVCLREIVLNAVEHGNLRVSFDEKTEAQAQGTYFEFLASRQREPDCRGKRVKVEYSITAERAVFRITDEGDGFDHKKFLANAAEPSPELLEHGRGLFMTLNAFDKVTYNEKGNQVTLVKNFSGQAPDTPE